MLTGKTQLVSFDQFNNTGATEVQMDGPALLEEKSSFKMLELNFSSKLDWGSTLNLLLTKTASKKIGALICSVKFLSPEQGCSISL